MQLLLLDLNLRDVFVHPLHLELLLVHLEVLSELGSVQARPLRVLEEALQLVLAQGGVLSVAVSRVSSRLESASTDTTHLALSWGLVALEAERSSDACESVVDGPWRASLAPHGREHVPLKSWCHYPLNRLNVFRSPGCRVVSLLVNVFHVQRSNGLSQLSGSSSVGQSLERRPQGARSFRQYVFKENLTSRGHCRCDLRELSLGS